MIIPIEGAYEEYHRRKSLYWSHLYRNKFFLKHTRLLKKCLDSVHVLGNNWAELAPSEPVAGGGRGLPFLFRGKELR